MLTVLMATRNGERLLPQVLEAYGRLREPPGGWKLVIVDNGSDDRTLQCLDAFTTRLPLTRLSEPAPGKNLALNTGLAAIAGDLVVFTDDDVFPRPDWLVELRRAADAHEDHAVFGGAVLPRWEAPPPDWILAWVRLGPVFTLSDPSLPEGPMRPYYVYGPNMAVRARVFAAGFRFDPTIGPRVGDYAMGSETEFVQRLHDAGYRAWHCRSAVVEHFIRRHQLSRSWILGRAVRYGRGQLRLGTRDVPNGARRWFGVPRYFLRELLGDGMAVVRARLRRDPQLAFQAEWQLRYDWGRVLEAWMSHRAPTPGQ
ncbi:MAG TPA: glycosyltransferase [Gemmatimonadales bacterium]|nr:glycosyltransferase [Gemmatimonadales bacterium]